jgi:DNA replication protein DnaC
MMTSATEVNRTDVARSRGALTGALSDDLSAATIGHYCRQLRTPAIAAQCGPLAEAAQREGQSHLRYLEALLAAEVEERERHAIEQRL